jgi:hypothetical protein
MIAQADQTVQPVDETAHLVVISGPLCAICSSVRLLHRHALWRPPLAIAVTGSQPAESEKVPIVPAEKTGAVTATTPAEQLLEATM